MNELIKVPEFLIKMLEEQYGKEITNKILQGYQTKRKITLRINNIKATSSEIKDKLKQAGIVFEEVAWSENAIVLQDSNENDIRKLDMYEKGEVYLQSLSSMLPPIILDPKKDENILDMAAAPGSKTTQIAAMTNNKCMITACEMNGLRAERLKYNLEKQGVTCTYVMVTDARRLDDFFSFDKILLDAPCSGSGTLYAFDEKLEKTFTSKRIQKSVESQRALLKKAIGLLKPGKEIVYSTCSILLKENEEILEKVLKDANAEIVPISLEKDLAKYKTENEEMQKLNNVIHITEIPLLPVKIPGTICVSLNELFEGFFIAKIRKK